MTTIPTANERDERAAALRAAFPNMPDGRDALFGALLEALAIEDEHLEDASAAPAPAEANGPR